MLSRTVVTIDGFEYTVVSEDPAEYTEKCAALVDGSIAEIKGDGRLSSVAAAVLAAMNIAGKYYKCQETCDDLRAQVRDYAEECSRLKAELYRSSRK